MPKTNPEGQFLSDGVDVRTGNSMEALKRAFVDNLFFVQGKFFPVATLNDYYMALAYTVRDRLLARWIETSMQYLTSRARTVCYLSAEFLLGPHLGNNLLNLGICDEVEEAMDSLGLSLRELLEQEEEPGLGNGGLGRLAACYLDSLATLQIPAIGYGIRYEFGIFDQAVRDGWQQEITDKWLRLGNPWEIARPEIAFDVKLGGRTESYHDASGRYRVRWTPERIVKGVAYDTPIIGYRVGNANLLRLFTAKATEAFELEAFNVGDYYRSVEAKVRSENITKVLYPNDEPAAGRELRLQQQYFFVTCALQDMIRIHLQSAGSVGDFDRKFAVQLNDTHPAIAVAELMRLLVDEHGMDWEPAWKVTQNTLAYTNHTLLPEALEKWPLTAFARVLPRHLEIIYELNHRFLQQVRRRYPDEDRVRRLSLIDESGERYVRMAHLAALGSHSINGVARLHTELLTRSVMSDFFDLWPERFSNKTNGVTPRRFMALANPRLSRLITSAIGENWLRDLDELERLEPLADDTSFRDAWRLVKQENKADLAKEIHRRTGVDVDPSSLFDVQVKRIHEYKRQQLNALHVVALFRRLQQDPRFEAGPRTVIFAGKAAPGYFMAKLIIKLVHSIAAVVNSDERVGQRLKVVFLPDYNVKLSHRIFPAADLSEQISTAGMEASGTGNMKFALNGALTIGTLDGANVEIREAVGPENFFLFGSTAEEVAARRTGSYRPRDLYDEDHRLRETIDLVASGRFSDGDRSLFRPLLDSLLDGDHYMVLADFSAYIRCQEDAERAYRDVESWTRRSILNVARMGRFSSDRAIREYCDEIWKVSPVPIQPADAPAPSVPGGPP
ncbi:MAG TPA: glycogen/starch/alpha-glucan phosphorylase [Vicinamibacteria bacterium]|nr:glycogen/starch/alpha-glucan phosphorylase [Vicinamibacteria bacterium]